MVPWILEVGFGEDGIVDRNENKSDALLLAIQLRGDNTSLSVMV